MSREEMDLLIKEYGVHAFIMMVAVLIIGIAAITAIQRIFTKQPPKRYLGFLCDVGLGVPVSAAILMAESVLFQLPISTKTLAMLAGISGLCIALIKSLAIRIQNEGFLSENSGGTPDSKN